MNLKMLAAALALALVQGAAVAAPVFTDDFSISSPLVQDTSSGLTGVWGAPVDIGSGIFRRIGVNRESGIGAESYDGVIAAVSGGSFKSVQGADTTGQVAILYTGSGLNALANPFTGAVTFSLRGNDVQPVTVLLFGSVSGEPPTSSTIVAGQTITTTGTSPIAPYPLFMSLFGTGDFGGGDSDGSDGFAILFQNESPAFALDFIIDDLALVSAPATLSILGLGLLGAAGFARRRQTA